MPSPAAAPAAPGHERPDWCAWSASGRLALALAARGPGSHVALQPEKLKPCSAMQVITASTLVSSRAGAAGRLTTTTRASRHYTAATTRIPTWYRVCSPVHWSMDLFSLCMWPQTLCFWRRKATCEAWASLVMRERLQVNVVSKRCRVDGCRKCAARPDHGCLLAAASCEKAQCRWLMHRAWV